MTIANSSRWGYKTKIWLYFYDKKFLLENSSLNFNVINLSLLQFSTQPKNIYIPKVLFTPGRKELRLYRNSIFKTCFLEENFVIEGSTHKFDRINVCNCEILKLLRLQKYPSITWQIILKTSLNETWQKALFSTKKGSTRPK